MEKWGTNFLQASCMKHVAEQLTMAMALVGMATSWVREKRAGPWLEGGVLTEGETGFTRDAGRRKEGSRWRFGKIFFRGKNQERGRFSLGLEKERAGEKDGEVKNGRKWAATWGFLFLQQRGFWTRGNLDSWRRGWVSGG